ncbi:AmmeMemoRadiSam system protein B [Candidatus Marinamargulisbacteria bacterium SCGC AG-410-N11]|nr:AmmeMemoRadiSam system protein B [Candidatus Marinamargulisbacteria bacterium SCGC AG-410-N11]
MANNSFKSILHTKGWYPSNSNDLIAMIEQDLLPDITEKVPIKAVIVPHAGYVFCSKVIGAVLRYVKGQQYSRILMLGPSHYVEARGIGVVCNYDSMETILGPVPFLKSINTQLINTGYFVEDNNVHQPEHALQVLFPYLRILQPDVPVIPIIIGQLNSLEIAEISLILKHLIDDQTLIVISSDFTHYGKRFGYLPFQASNDKAVSEGVRAIDMAAINAILDNDVSTYDRYIKQAQPTICGRFAIQILLEIIKDKKVESSLVDYVQSGDISRDWSHTVSYAGIRFSVS